MRSQTQSARRGKRTGYKLRVRRRSRCTLRSSEVAGEGRDADSTLQAFANTLFRIEIRRTYRASVPDSWIELSDMRRTKSSGSQDDSSSWIPHLVQFEGIGPTLGNLAPGEHIYVDPEVNNSGYKETASGRRTSATRATGSLLKNSPVAIWC